MPRLVLLNGEPGSGKSTLAHQLAQDEPLMLAMDVDTLKHSLAAWDHDPTGAGLRARTLAIAAARKNLRRGFTVIVAQYLAKTTFIEQLETLAAHLPADFIEITLIVDPTTLAARITGRGAAPDRPEHHVNNRLVGPGDAVPLAASIDAVLRLRPHARRIDATGSLDHTLHAVRAAITSHPGTP